MPGNKKTVGSYYQAYINAFKKAYGYYPQYSPVTGKKIKK